MPPLVHAIPPYDDVNSSTFSFCFFDLDQCCNAPPRKHFILIQEQPPRMPLTSAKTNILDELRHAAKGVALDEIAAWRDIQGVMESMSSTSINQEPRGQIDRYIYGLGLVFAHHTGAMPGYTNADGSTRFERFALAVPMPGECRVTQNRIKGSIRRLDAKKNPVFSRALLAMKEGRAAKASP